MQTAKGNCRKKRKIKSTPTNDNEQPNNPSELEPLKDDHGEECVSDLDNGVFPHPYETGSYMGETHAEDPYILQFLDKKSEKGLIPFVTHSVQMVNKNTAFTVYNRDCECDWSIRNLIDAKYDQVEKSVKPFRDQLLALYFRFIDWTYPAVDKKKFYRAYFRNDAPLNKGLICSMLGLSCTYWKYSTELCTKPIPRTLQEDLWRLSWYYIEHDINCVGASLDTVQAFLLYIQRRMAGDGIHEQVKSRIHVGMLVSLSFSMGLHLDCSSWEISSVEKASRHRLWALVYFVDKWTAANLGHPSLLNSAISIQKCSFDSEFPQEKRFVHLIRLTNILAGILDDIYGPNSLNKHDTDIPSTAHLYLTELRTWRSTLPEHLSRLDALNEHKYCSNGMIHLSSLAIEVLIFRKLLLPEYGGKYRHEAHDLVQRIINFCLGISHSHLHAFWISTCRLSLCSLAHFVLRYHAQSNKTERTQNATLMRSWFECIRSLNHGWEEGIGLTYHKMDSLFYKGQTNIELPIIDSEVRDSKEQLNGNINSCEKLYLKSEKPLVLAKDATVPISNIDTSLSLDFVDQSLHDMLYDLIWL